MTATDPASFAALVLLIAVIALALRLRASRRRRKALARRLAQRTGHPSVTARARQEQLGPEIERIP
ncbi:hypothetical protein FJY71_06800 [candidate division WOR-3 bacterium]|nr:hypothetical protein [candidate division WOR-3 bacterium]